jgi:hypothetical protein
MAKNTLKQNTSNEKVIETKHLRMKVDFPHLLEAEENPGVLFGLQLTLGMLRNIAHRAIEINDSVILTELEALGIVHEEKK